MNIMLKLHLILISIFSLFTPVLASLSVEPQIVNYSAASGLPSNEVTSIAEDDMGMMWFGTTNGLARFDGYEFKVFRSDYLSPSFLKSNSIRFMEKAPDGKLWIVTNKEVAVFDTRTQILEQVEINKDLLKTILSLLVTRKGDVYIGTTKGLYIYINNKFELINQKRIKKLYVNALYEDVNNDIWIGTWSSGFYKYEQRTGKVHSYINKLKLKELRVTGFAEDKHGRLWVSTWDSYGLIRVDQPANVNSNKLRIFQVSKEKSWNSGQVMYKLMYEPIDDKLWIASADGLYLVDCMNDSSALIVAKDKYLDTFEIKNLFRNSNGTLWASVLGYGVNRIIRKQLPFSSFLGDKKNKDNIITSLYQSSDQNLWIGKRLGVMSIYDYITDDLKDFESIDVVKGLSLKSNAVLSFVNDTINNLLWLSTRYDGLYCIDFNKKYGKLLYRLRDKNPDLRFSSSLVSIENGVLYAVGNKLYEVFFNEVGTFTVNSCDVLNKELGQSNVTSLCINNGVVWIGTDDGIVCANKKNEIKKYNTRNKKLIYNSVLCIYIDSQENVWVGTNGGGLSKYNIHSDCFQMVPSVQPVSDYIIYSIIEDENLNLWMATGKGVCKMNIIDMNNVRLYTKYDGLKNTQFTPGTVLKLSDSRLLFGGYNGIDCYNPIYDNVDTLTKRTVVVDISIMNTDIKYVLEKEKNRFLPPYTDNLELLHNQNNMTLTFSSLSYINPNSVSYAYKMDGIDYDWAYVDADQRRVSYNNLQPGKYQFLVKSCNENGLWSPVETMSITILPPPWFTWWAYIIYVIIITAAVYISYRIIHNRIKLQNELRIEQIEHQKSDEVNQVKLKFFTNISHELFTPLSVMQCSVESLKMDNASDSHTLDIMQINLRRLKRLLQQIMEFRKVESGNLKLKVSYNDIVPFIKNVCAENFQPLLERKSITMDFRCEQDSMFAWFDIDKLDKILYNLLSNALKYNYEGGVIVVSLRETEEQGKRRITIVVENTGDGIPENKLSGLFRRFYEGDYRKFHTQGTGIGLSLTKDLVELHHGEISVSSIVGQVTSFTINLPADKDDYSSDEIDECISSTENHDGGELPQDLEEQKSDILLVEDDPDLLSVMNKVLGKVYNVHPASNGKEAMAYLKSEGKADIIITDYVMPEMNGIELCKSIREDEELYYLPIVMLTAKTQAEFQKLGYAAGADVYLPKPIEMSVLIAQINSIINNRRMVAKKYLSEEAVETAEEKDNGLSEADKEFLDKAVAIIEENMENSEFTNDMLYDKMNTTQSTMYRRLKSLTGFLLMNLSVI